MSDLIERIERRLKSINGVSVERAFITAEEWGAIAATLRKNLSESGELTTAQAENEALRQVLQGQMTAQWRVGFDCSSAFILRKQAEAVEDCAQYFGGRDFSDVRFIIGEHAQRLRQQADELDKAGGE